MQVRQKIVVGSENKNFFFLKRKKIYVHSSECKRVSLFSLQHKKSVHVCVCDG